MGTEFERKFLLTTTEYFHPEAYRSGGTNIVQGYLSEKPCVRVRTTLNTPNEFHGFLTVKGPGLLERPEFEYEIPYEEGVSMLAMCPDTLKKVRFTVYTAGHLWEVDRFGGHLEGLWLAEVELKNSTEYIEHPAWLGKEVTFDARYQNVNLIKWGVPQEDPGVILGNA